MFKPFWLFTVTNILRGAGNVVVSTSIWHASGPVSIPGQGKHGIFGVNIRLSTLGTCELENHINVGPVPVCDVKEPLRTTSTLAVTTLSASIERSAW